MASSSPLHASFPKSIFQNNSNNENSLLPGSGEHRSPRDGPGSRQTRRLQLRNAGFRGPAVPTRKVTPKSLQPSTSTVSSTMSSASGNWMGGGAWEKVQSSDAENVSPSGKRAGEGSGVFGSARESSGGGGILQDVGNSSTLRQAKRARPRVTSSKFWSSEGGSKHDSAYTDDPHSPPPSAIRPRSARARAKMSKPRRSVSAETRKYVDHLEAELSEAQTQLSAMTSPSVTREQSSKMRHLNAETRQLQEEVAAWEAKFEERVQEEVDRHFQLEAGLRSRVRTLEQEAEDTKYRMQELETALECTTQNLDAVETANVNLEKRLEIMSELLAASPTKIDLHAETPLRPRHGRPKSMLPRFPTAGSLAASPERVPSTQPGSPAISHASLSHVRLSPAIPISPVNFSFSPEVTSSDDEAGMTDASFGTNNDMGPPPSVRSRPIRRMRRFGAGSVGPKPLILPSTSYCEQIPHTAPPREQSETGPAFPFPPLYESAFDGTRRSGRRRASTESGELPVRLSLSLLQTFDSVEGEEGMVSSVLGYRSPPSPGTSRNFSSLGSAVGAAIGRNLMDELTAARTSESDSFHERRSDGYEEQPTNLESQTETVLHSSPFHSDVEDERPSNLEDHRLISLSLTASSRFVSGSSTAVATSTAMGTIRQPSPPKLRTHSRTSSRSLGAQTQCSISTLDSLASIFSDLFRSPVELAKHLVQRAQARMSIPRPFLNIQWWLVGVLLGPMARKRMLGRAHCCDENERQSLLESPNTGKEDDQLAFGTAYRTPPATGSPSPIRARSLVAGKGRKRAASVKSVVAVKHASHCQCPKRSTHSPWLWLKFSMTLALAVGVAFKDGPGSLLKETACACRVQKQRSLGAVGKGSGNRRKARRDEESVRDTPVIDGDVQVTRAMVGARRIS